MRETNRISNHFQKDRLKIARMAKGLTQTSLAEALGFSRQYMHQVEIGDRTPNAESIEAFADLLDVTPYFFERPVQHLVTSDEVNFRKQKTTKLQFENKVIAMSSLLREVAGEISNDIAMPDVKLTQAEFTDIKSIEDAAQLVRKELGLGVNSPIDSVTRVLEVCGVICVNADNIPEKISALSVDLDRPLVIHNSLNEQLTRTRYDLSHELAHLVGHRGITTGDDETERQADKFASFFLISSAAFRANCPLRGRGKINWSAMKEFKQEWKISYKAIVRRAHDMGLIDAVTYKNALIQLSAAGYSKREPDEPDGDENPKLIHNAIAAMQNVFDIYLEEMMSKIGIKPAFLEALLGVAIEDKPNLENVVMLSKYKVEKRTAS